MYGDKEKQNPRGMMYRREEGMKALCLARKKNVCGRARSREQLCLWGTDSGSVVQSDVAEEVPHR